MKKIIIENIKTIFYALVIALLIRSFFFQPFYIPSSSMEPTLLVGDRLFVSKFSYGYSRHSFPFSIHLFKERIIFNQPQRGDVVVFKVPINIDSKTKTFGVDYNDLEKALPDAYAQGEDVNPYIIKAEKLIEQYPMLRFATVSGRYYSESLDVRKLKVLVGYLKG